MFYIAQTLFILISAISVVSSLNGCDVLAAARVHCKEELKKGNIACMPQQVALLGKDLQFHPDEFIKAVKPVVVEHDAFDYFLGEVGLCLKKVKPGAQSIEQLREHKKCMHPLIPLLSIVFNCTLPYPTH